MRRIVSIWGPRTVHFPLFPAQLAKRTPRISAKNWDPGASLFEKLLPDAMKVSFLVEGTGRDGRRMYRAEFLDVIRNLVAMRTFISGRFPMFT